MTVGERDMSYSSFSTKISDYLAEELNYTEEKKRVIAYSIDGLLLTIAGFAAIMTVGWILGIPKATFFAMICGDILRKFSGGAHFSTPFRCLVTGAVTYPLVTFIALQAGKVWGNERGFQFFIIFLLTACIISVVNYAPVDSSGKPIVSMSFKKKLKIASTITVVALSLTAVIINDNYISVSIAGGLAIQSFTLLPFLKRKL